MVHSRLSRKLGNARPLCPTKAAVRITGQCRIGLTAYPASFLDKSACLIPSVRKRASTPSPVSRTWICRGWRTGPGAIAGKPRHRPLLSAICRFVDFETSHPRQLSGNGMRRQHRGDLLDVGFGPLATAIYANRRGCCDRSNGSFEPKVPNAALCTNVRCHERAPKT